jgi:hypothetical protein
MKQILLILGLAVVLFGMNTSCKENTLDRLRENEITALDKYVKDNNLTDAKDVSGIYFKLIEPSTDTTLIRSGFKVMLEFKITLLDGAAIPVDYYFTTDDGYGHNYEPRAFYVDVSNDYVNQEYIQQIAGLHRGLKKMHVGDKAFMVIPSELAFKAVDNSSFGIPRFSTLLATVYVKSGISAEEQSK